MTKTKIDGMILYFMIVYNFSASHIGPSSVNEEIEHDLPLITTSAVDINKEDDMYKNNYKPQSN